MLWVILGNKHGDIIKPRSKQYLNQEFCPQCVIYQGIGPLLPTNYQSAVLHGIFKEASSKYNKLNLFYIHENCIHSI